jgi:ribonuclease-3
LRRTLLRIYNYFFSSDKAFVRELSTILGFVPARLSFYRQAFSHRSTMQNDPNMSSKSNERLEFLGDAILGAVVAEYLFRKYHNRDEGFLTKMRSKIVKRKSLNEIASQMGFDLFLRRNGLDAISDSMLGNAFEAFIGAIYLDMGYAKTQQFILAKILKHFIDIRELEEYDDNYKSQLLEYCQKNGKSIDFSLVGKTKSGNRDLFKVAVLVANETISTAEDFNKKNAEQTAAQKALISLGQIDNNHS